MSVRTITKDMPEPEEYGPFLISAGDGKPLFIAHHRESGTPGVAWSDIEMDDCSWRELVMEVRGCSIESLAERDARIRREALTLSDEEAAVGEDAIADYLGAPGEEAMFDYPTEDMLKAALKAVSECRERES